MTAMERTGTVKVSLKKEDFELVIERPSIGRGDVFAPCREDSDENPMRSDIEHHRSSISPVQGEGPGTAGRKAPETESSLLFVTSPMVGTFYSAPGPDEASFVKVGDRVDKETVVCIVEAMKVMNEVKAGVTGVVAALLVQNGHPVEFGTKLLSVTPPSEATV